MDSNFKLSRDNKELASLVKANIENEKKVINRIISLLESATSHQREAQSPFDIVDESGTATSVASNLTSVPPVSA